MSECDAPYVHRIMIDSSKDAGQRKDKTESRLIHEIAIPSTSVTPPKPLRSEVVVKLRKASTFRHERPVINQDTFERPSLFVVYEKSLLILDAKNSRIVKRLSINVCSPQVFTFDSDDRVQSTTSSYPSSSVPMKPILKRTSRYVNRLVVTSLIEPYLGTPLRRKLFSVRSSISMKESIPSLRRPMRKGLAWEAISTFVPNFRLGLSPGRSWSSLQTWHSSPVRFMRITEDIQF